MKAIHLSFWLLLWLSGGLDSILGLLSCHQFVTLFVGKESKHSWMMADALVLVRSTNETYEDRIAAFGPRLTHPVTGILLSVEDLTVATSMRPHVESLDEASSEAMAGEGENNNKQQPQSDSSAVLKRRGCLQYETTSFLPLNMSWIALVERGSCAFVDKVRNLQKAGAVGVIVGDNEQNKELPTMYAGGDTSDIYIPSVFVYQWEYRDLRSQVLRYLRLNPHDHPSRDPQQDTGRQQGRKRRRLEENSGVATSVDPFIIVSLMENTTASWPLLDVIIVTVVAPTILLLFLVLAWRFRQRRLQLLQSLRSTEMDANEGLLTQSDLDTHLPMCTFETTAEGRCFSDTCVVCLDEFTDGDKIRRLPQCGHEFHSSCIDPWLMTRKRYCPMCKADVLPPVEPTSPTSPSTVITVISEQTPLLLFSADASLQQDGDESDAESENVFYVDHQVDDLRRTSLDDEPEQAGSSRRSSAWSLPGWSSVRRIFPRWQSRSSLSIPRRSASLPQQQQ